MKGPAASAPSPAAAEGKKQELGPPKSLHELMFRAADLDNDGHLTEEEFKMAMLKGYELENEDLVSLWEDADQDKDGKCSFDELVEIMIGLEDLGPPKVRAAAS